jgi:hypothetical protein
MANEPIPLEDDGQNDSSHSDWLIPLESDGGADAKEPLGVPGEELASRITAISSDPGVRSPRKEARKAIDGVWVLFEPDASCGGSMQVECPLVDISIAGFSVVYDKPIRAGLKGYVSYRSMCDKPIRVAFTVRRYTRVSESRYLIGASFDKRLNIEDRRPAKTRPGRQVVLGVRARRILAETPVESPASANHDFQLPAPHAIAPQVGMTEEIPLADD